MDIEYRADELLEQVVHWAAHLSDDTDFCPRTVIADADVPLDEQVYRALRVLPEDLRLFVVGYVNGSQLLKHDVENLLWDDARLRENITARALSYMEIISGVSVIFGDFRVCWEDDEVFQYPPCLFEPPLHTVDVFINLRGEKHTRVTLSEDPDFYACLITDWGEPRMETNERGTTKSVRYHPAINAVLNHFARASAR